MSTIALAYVRVSTDRQDLSVETQSEQVRRAADYLQAGPPEIFAEANTSGSIEFARRPEGQRLLARVQTALAAGDSVTVIVPKVDRLGRDTIDISHTARTFDAQGVRLVFLDINVDTRTAMGRAFMQIAAVFAELERARIRERINEALARKRANGEALGTEPYGWDAMPTDRTSAAGVPIRMLQDNLEQQKWILQMRTWRAAEWSYGQIARELNQLGVPTKTGAGNIVQRKGEHRFTTGKWSAGKVHKVLTNKTVTAWLQSRPALAA